MGEKSSKPEINYDHPPIKPTTPEVVNPYHLEHRLLQNVLLLWVDKSIDLENAEHQQMVSHFRNQVNDIALFTDVDACIEFLDGIHEERIIIVTSGSLGQTELVRKVHEMDIVDRIYIFCQDRKLHKTWIKSWSKIKDAYIQIEPIVQDLSNTARQCNEDLVPLSFINPTQVKTFDATFTYSQMFKKILLSLTYDDQSRETFLRNYSIACADNTHETPIIKEFYEGYHPKNAIQWYTRLSFVHQMLNRALRLLEADLIVDLAFLIHDLHRQLEVLHEEQYGTKRGKAFTVYRGQGLSKTSFDKLKHVHGELLSCNSFLSASKRRSHALQFAKNAAQKEQRIGVLFTITVDPKLNVVPFAHIIKHRYVGAEVDFLFSIHAVFRIERILQLDKNERLFEIHLTMIENNDPSLHHHIHLLEKQLGGPTGGAQLAYLLIKIGEISRGEALFQKLLQQPQTSEHDRALYLQELGRIRELRHDYTEAIRYYEQALLLERRIFPPDYPDLANSYKRVGQSYWNIGNLTCAVPHFEEALRIQQAMHPKGDLALATLCKKIGSIYNELQEYSKALCHFEKATEIQEQHRDQHHADLIALYNTLATTHIKMKSLDKALLNYEKALQLQRKTLPSNHPSLAQCYFDIGTTYTDLNEHRKAISSFEQAAEIEEKILSPDHPELGLLYNNMGSLHNQIGEHAKALSYYQKDLEICRKTLPEYHLDLMTSYSNMGGTYCRLQEYEKALPFFEQALLIARKSLPSSHPDIDGILQWIELIRSKL